MMRLGVRIPCILRHRIVLLFEYDFRCCSTRKGPGVATENKEDMRKSNMNVYLSQFSVVGASYYVLEVDPALFIITLFGTIIVVPKSWFCDRLGFDLRQIHR